MGGSRQEECRRFKQHLQLLKKRVVVLVYV